mmetsp:Transcript_56/g.290  ORF Transcript_56/g.290 Transcript_56/m.290 type:complete len:482 (-) Transcript_56:170-1615(-)
MKGCDLVPPHPSADELHQAQFRLGHRRSLISRLRIVLRRLGEVLGNAPRTVVVDVAKRNRRRNIAILGIHAVVIQNRVVEMGRVGLAVGAGDVAQAGGLGRRVDVSATLRPFQDLVRGQLVVLGGLLAPLRNPVSVEIAVSHRHLRLQMTSGGRCPFVEDRPWILVGLLADAREVIRGNDSAVQEGVLHTLLLRLAARDLLVRFPFLFRWAKDRRGRVQLIRCNALSLLVRVKLHVINLLLEVHAKVRGPIRLSPEGILQRPCFGRHGSRLALWRHDDPVARAKPAAESPIQHARVVSIRLPLHVANTRSGRLAGAEESETVVHRQHVLRAGVAEAGGRGEVAPRGGEIPWENRLAAAGHTGIPCPHVTFPQVQHAGRKVCGESAQEQRVDDPMQPVAVARWLLICSFQRGDAQEEKRLRHAMPSPPDDTAHEQLLRLLAFAHMWIVFEAEEPLQAAPDAWVACPKQLLRRQMAQKQRCLR